MRLVGNRVWDTIGQVRISTRAILGCDGEALVRHLEANYAAGQTWANHGEAWHIDHIVAIRSPGILGGKPTLFEMLARMHYTNLQPLSVSDHKLKTRVERRSHLRCSCAGRDAHPPSKAAEIAASITAELAGLDLDTLFIEYNNEARN
jgi:hypothetical protein